MKKTAVVFPGLSDFHYGVVNEFIEKSRFAQARFDEASQILGFSLLDRFKQENQSYTEISQCANFTSTIALLDSVRDLLPSPPNYCIGGSFGGIAVAVFVESLTFKDALLLTYHSSLEEQAYNHKTSEKYVTHFFYRYPLTKTKELIQEINEQGRWIELSAIISDKLLGICSTEETVELFKKRVRKERGMPLGTINRLIHSSSLRDFKERLKDRIYQQVLFDRPRIPIVSDVDGRILRNAKGLKQMLLEGIDHPIRWDLTTSTLKKLNINEAHIIGTVDVLGPTLKGLFDTTFYTFDGIKQD